jgi:hypothetical protein
MLKKEAAILSTLEARRQMTSFTFEIVSKLMKRMLPYARVKVLKFVPVTFTYPSTMSKRSSSLIVRQSPSSYQIS